MISTSPRSSLPPKYPEIRPSGTPIVSDSTSESSTTFSSVWAPQTTRESTSVDCTVVPNRWSCDGALQLREAPAVGAVLVELVRREPRREQGKDAEEEGDRRAEQEHHPREAARLARSAPRSAAGRDDAGAGGAVGRVARRRPSVADPRVDERVDEVDHDADGHDDQREDDDDPLHGRVVAVLEVDDQLMPDARPVEGRLGQHRAPSRSSAICRPTIVTTGTSAFRKAWW